MAHARGKIKDLHRDLKPENISLTEDSTAKVRISASDLQLKIFTFPNQVAPFSLAAFGGKHLQLTRFGLLCKDLSGLAKIVE